MPYVVMAAGALMLAIGLYAIISGSRIVQVEEGWTSVIAGSVLVAGGVLTIALGLVTRVLLQIKAAAILRPATTGTESEAPKAVPFSFDRSNMYEEPTESFTPPGEPVVTTQEAPAHDREPAPAAEELRRAHPEDAPREPDQEMPAQEALFSEPPIRRTKPVLSLQRPRPAPPVAEPAPAAETSSEAEPLDEPEPDHPIDTGTSARPADDYKLETPSTPEHDLTEAKPEPPVAVPPRAPSAPRVEPKVSASAATAEEAPPAVDWLDRAFAEIDEELPIRAPVRSVETSAPASEAKPKIAEPEPPVPPPLETRESATAPEPEEEEVPHAIEAAPTVDETAAKHPPAVVGRYEADGTSYTMYADGSIEAQSEAGTYRFASMAELKAFIEG